MGLAVSQWLRVTHFFSFVLVQGEEEKQVLIEHASFALFNSL